GIICTGETYKRVVKLTFAKGSSLEDPSGLFNSSLDGNTRRAIDIVLNTRIIYAYEMKLGESRISASLTTVAFEAAPGGTKMVFTEQVVFL
ncbi:ATPase, partial [Rhizobium leguminosarum]